MMVCVCMDCQAEGSASASSIESARKVLSARGMSQVRGARPLQGVFPSLSILFPFALLAIVLVFKPQRRLHSLPLFLSPF